MGVRRARVEAEGFVEVVPRLGEVFAALVDQAAVDQRMAVGGVGAEREVHVGQRLVV